MFSSNIKRRPTGYKMVKDLSIIFYKLEPLSLKTRKKTKENKKQLQIYQNHFIDSVDKNAQGKKLEMRRKKTEENRNLISPN